MAKERARKRAEREAAAERERAQRARKRVRRERVERGKRAVASLVPDAPKRTPGLLARRKRRRPPDTSPIFSFMLPIAFLLISPRRCPPRS